MGTLGKPEKPVMSDIGMNDTFNKYFKILLYNY